MKKHRLAGLVLAGLAVVGIGVTADIAAAPPAEAATAVQYCNWPNRARIGWTGNVTVTAYSPGGAYLGRTSGSHGYWYTPWEDVRFVITANGGYSTACYWGGV